jgi:transposase InsO family protein
MKAHGLLLQRDGERREERRHDGRVAVDQRNTRWCSDGLEIACDNGEKVRVAFALDCCDREAMGHVATTGGITAEDVRDLMVATVEHRYGQVNRVPEPIEWLTDNGSCYTARDTRAFARHRVGAAHDAGQQPAVERYGRGVRPHAETRLRPREPKAGCQDGHRPAARLVRLL